MKPIKRKNLEHTIRGDKWKIKLLCPEYYTKQYGADSAALTLPKEKILAFSTDEISLNVVTHEVTHAFITYLHYEDANLSLDQLEEMFCSMMEHQGQELLDCAKELYKKMEPYYFPIDNSPSL